VTESRLVLAADQFKSEQKKSNSRVSFLDQAKHEYQIKDSQETGPESKRDMAKSPFYLVDS
jgi:hypothetical protein